MAQSPHTDDLKPFSFEHRVRRLSGRNPPAKPPPQQHRFRRDLVFLGAAITVAILIAPFADVPTPDYPEARAQADTLNAAYRSVWGGNVSVEAAAGAYGLNAYELPVGQRVVWMMTHPQPTTGGTCYGLRTGGGMATVAVKFAPMDGCEPQQGTAVQGVGLWEDVLPSERTTAVWFVPAIAILASCAVVISTNIILKLLLQTDR